MPISTISKFLCGFFLVFRNPSNLVFLPTKEDTQFAPIFLSHVKNLSLRQNLSSELRPCCKTDSTGTALYARPYLRRSKFGLAWVHIS